jgi:hypothetical protein
MVQSQEVLSTAIQLLKENLMSFIADDDDFALQKVDDQKNDQSIHGRTSDQPVSQVSVRAQMMMMMIYSPKTWRRTPCLFPSCYSAMPLFYSPGRGSCAYVEPPEIDGRAAAIPR